MRSARLIRACLAAALAVAAVAVAAPVAAQEGGEVRITARKHNDGRVEFALQQRQGDDTWSERRLPSRRFFPATAAAGRWLNSSPLTLDGGDEVRITARKHDDGRVEFALQQRRGDDTWSERRLPSRRFFPATATAGRWLNSSPLTLDALTGVSVLRGTSACVDRAAEDAGFTDVGGSSNEVQINCIAHYGVTLGTSEGVFSPSATVNRVHMALFVHRAAGVAGVDFEPDANDPVVTISDIGNWPDNVLDAIEALFAKGVIPTSFLDDDNAFSPSEPITRAETAILLRNLVQVANPDLFDSDGALRGVSSLTRFSDVAATRYVTDAISTSHELGIVTGVSSDSFAPDSLIDRGQMAVSIARALDHMNARPAGLTVQRVGTAVVVSMRDGEHKPVTGAYVDVFLAGEDVILDEEGASYVDPEYEDRAKLFLDDGSCNLDVVTEAPRSQHAACEIDTGDARTDGNGNLRIDLGNEIGSDALQVVVWHGNLGDKFGDATDRDDWNTVTLRGTTF